MQGKSILVLGAGRSSAVLIEYLARQVQTFDGALTVGDISLEAAQRVTQNLKAKAITFDIQNRETSAEAISMASIVVSLLPAHLHHLVGALCLQYNCHLITASYVSPEMQALHAAAESKGLLFLNECGLDPGIDHMSAMEVIHKIKTGGGELESFESFTGGLISPETDKANPWRYKFTWNARNVVMAGQSTAKYLEDNQYKYIPYQQLFQRTTQVSVPGLGAYEGYANRDSLKYIHAYGLSSVKTMLRGTLRNQGFCEAWNVFVQLGCCDDSYPMEGVEAMTHAGFFGAFLGGGNANSLQGKLKTRLGLSPEVLHRLEYVGVFSDEPIGLEKGTPAQILEHILNKKWRLNPGDLDQIVMWHRFVFMQGVAKKEIQATLVATGEDAVRTAMAKTVGLPMGIAAKLLVTNKLIERGVVIPINPGLFKPILMELENFGIKLTEFSNDLEG